MPTGYTYAVQDGSITTFKDFALRCARGMGACIMQRESPLDELPKEQVPSDYHSKALETTRLELAKVDAMTDAEIVAACDTEYESHLAEFQRRSEETATHRDRYNKMIAQVESWTPPTDDYQNFKNFMLEQLWESIKHDCYEPERPVRVTAKQWKSEKVNRLMSDIDYHTKHNKEEIERTNQRNEWIRQLYASLAAMPTENPPV